MVWTGCWAPVLSSNMADFFRFLTFPQYFFLRENFKSYSENALFNSLVCKKCFIMLLYKHFWLTIWPWKLTMLHFVKFKILPHTFLVIQFHLHLWANFHQLKKKIYIYICLKDKQIATKEHKCPNKILLIKLMKSWLKNRTVRPRIVTMNQIKKMKQSYNDIAFVFSVWHSGQSFCKSNFIIVTSCH